MAYYGSPRAYQVATGKHFQAKDHAFTEPGVFAEWSSSDFGQKMQIK